MLLLVLTNIISNMW